MTIPEKIIHRCLYLVMGLGAILRLNVYFQNRSLFIDEASLSTQIILGSYGDMFGNFVHQYAPPFFNVLVKSSTELFGATEYALRLIPLLAGLVSISLFYLLCKHFLESVHILFPLFLFCFSIYMLRYTTEVKQYSSDIAVGLGFLIFCIKHPPSQLRDKHFLALALLGMAGVWLSMPLVFLLFSIGCYYGIYFLRYKKRLSFVKWAFVILGWLMSFGIYFFGIIRNDIGHEGLENYHAPFFFPLLPTSPEELNRGIQLILGFYRTAIGSTVIAIGLGILATAMGYYRLFRKDRLLGGLFLLPILVCIIASGLKYYSLIPRLTLFFIPLLLLVIGIGTRQLFKLIPQKASWILVGLLIIILVNQKGYPYFIQKYQIEELRPVLDHLANHATDDDLVYVHYQAENAFRFYTQAYEYADRYAFKNTTIGKWDAVFPDAVENADYKLTWMVFSHLKKEDVDKILSSFEGGYSIEKGFGRKGACTFPLY